MNDLSRTRILIVEPDPDVRKTLQLYFEENGHQIKTIDLGADVLRIVRPWQPNAILISNALKDKNPYQLCRNLLEDTLAGHIPLVMLLQFNERNARLQALEVGVDDVIPKPFDIEELRLRVEAAIRFSTMRAIV